MSEIETCISLDRKCNLLLLGFSANEILSTDFGKIQNPSSCSQVVPCGQTDGQKTDRQI